MSLQCMSRSWLPRILTCFRSYTTLPEKERLSHVSNRLLNHLHHNRLQQAHVMLLKQTIPLPVHFYNFVLKGYAKNFQRPNKLEKSLEILQLMKERGVEPSSQSYIQLIMGLAQKGTRLTKEQADLMQTWFDEFVRIESGSTSVKKPFAKFKKLMRCIYYRGHPNLKGMFYHFLDTFREHKLGDSETWNLVIVGCIRWGNIEDAEDILKRAREEKVANSTSFQVIIKAHLNQGNRRSASMIFKLLLKDEILADRETYETFIKYYLRQKNSTEMIKRLWQGVLMTTQPGDVIQPNTVIKLTQYYRKHDALTEAEQVYLDLKMKQQTLTMAYIEQVSWLMAEFADRKQFNSTVSLYLDMIGSGYKPDREAVERMLSALQDNNKFDLIQQIMSVTTPVLSDDNKD
ncbi:hypothetical protein RMATCC62417_00662 [Rhizopus microsporus]|nr:hypothetical protein RMATCC62417_00662 [Rhizopus microsporus]